MSLWSRYVLPTLVEKACRSSTIRQERERWLPRAHGRVLEVGIGSGLNLPFYDRERVEQIVGVDPSAELLERARARIGEIPVELVAASAEELPVEGAFDSAVVTYSLCSIPDPVRALRRVRRVLKPGGELILVEHGLAEKPNLQRWQRAITPVWKRIAGGCHMDRDIAAILGEAGFAFEELSTGHSEGAQVLSYTYQGVAH